MTFVGMQWARQARCSDPSASGLVAAADIPCPAAGKGGAAEVYKVKFGMPLTIDSGAMPYEKNPSTCYFRATRPERRTRWRVIIGSAHVTPSARVRDFCSI